MIELFLNLLSPEKKRRISDLVNFIFIKNILEIATFVTAVAGIFVLGSWIVVAEEYHSLTQSAISINKEYGGQNQETHKINKILYDLNTSAENYATISDKLAVLIQATPDGIVLNSIGLNRQNKGVIISGNARDRVVLLGYQTALKGIPWLDQVNTPSAQLFQKENIYFEIKGQLKDIPVAGAPTAKNRPTPNN
ncbi:MAG: hypothetical protein Q7S66_00395 [bacterium]|nr:hypothetical protein [bacterium]